MRVINLQGQEVYDANDTQVRLLSYKMYMSHCVRTVIGQNLIGHMALGLSFLSLYLTYKTVFS